MDTIELGDKVREKVTGLVGIITGVHHWLYGCDSVTLQPQELKDGKKLDPSNWDIHSLEILQKRACQPLERPITTGGPVQSVESVR